MKKWITLFALTIISTAQANWGDFTYLGTINYVNFSYRSTEAVDGQQVQFRVQNFNNIRARIKISEIQFHCVDGQTETRSNLSFNMKGGEETLTTPFLDVCKGLGGLDHLNVNLDARVRR